VSETCINLDDLFDGEKFVPMKAVNELTNLTNSYPLLTPVVDGRPQQIYLYHEADGIWRPDGETWVKDVLQRILGEKARVKTLNEVKELVKVATYIDHECFKEDPGTVVLLNGSYDLHTGTLNPHSPLNYAKSRLPVRYDPGADCPEIKKFLHEIAPNDVETLQEWVGYHLLKHYRYQRAVILLGSGNNGKSTFLDLLTRFLGVENVSNESLYQLSTQRFSTSQLYRKLANICPDISPDEIRRTGTFKAVTGGDWIRAEFKNRDPFKFQNYAKLTFSCNQIPATPDESNAFFRRFMIIKFNQVFDGEGCDKNIIDRLTTPQELSGFFNYALEGLNRLLKNGDFTGSQTAEEIREKYIEMSDPVTAFVNHHIVEDPDAYEPKDSVYRAYHRFCKERGYVPIATNRFSAELKTRVYCRDGQRRIGDGRPKVWNGIKMLKTVTDVNDVNPNYTLPLEILENFSGDEVKRGLTPVTRVTLPPVEAAS